MKHKFLQQEKAKEHNIGRIVEGVLIEPKLTREQTLYNAKNEAIESLIAAVANRSTPIDYVREVSDLHFSLVMNHYKERQKNNYKR